MKLFSKKTKCATTPSDRPVSRRRKFFRRAIRFTVGGFLVYLLILLIGLIPVNTDFKPADEGVEIFITSNGVHADVIVPLITKTVDWREYFPAECFEGDVTSATHIAIGWGDKNFYIKTRTWDDFKTTNALKALFSPSPCCLHVVMMQDPKTSETVRSVRISQSQYVKMVEAIQESFTAEHLQGGHPPGNYIADSAYHQNDAFYEALGNYHIFNTCNSWVGHIMRSSGIKAPLLTPMPGTVFLYLPE